MKDSTKINQWIATASTESYLLTTLDGSRKHVDNLLEATGDLEGWKSMKLFFDNLERIIIVTAEAKCDAVDAAS